jgi:hypothetical protein
MKLSDVMSAADLAVYAEIGLVIFFAAFVAVAIRVIFMSKSGYSEELSLPFNDNLKGIADLASREERS